ncbi:substrate-binding domain-containing protein [Luteolibacter arcticus]|uniref:Substrate-binding domain-containing protein n=1 Tax=Luteolibacter arcticus TaxID=1581411 RepID=A0ABT3GLN5_9BACT|nr:substrate-binding domain-containing protein [Luteolibacter arcticus]MCW1924381.1 substrate-binding domain-containing protein [Luteolibacter arcticus]
MPEGPRLTLLGKLLIFVFIGACCYGAYALFAKKPLVTSPGNGPQAGPAVTTPQPGASPVKIGIAYGTEKQRWLLWAVEQFASSKEGAGITVDLIPMGSLEGAQAILNGDQRLNVWSPASALYEDVFTQEWQIKHNKNPILRKEALALSPMVFVMWQERHEAFVAKYKEVSFETVGKALKEPGGWDAIAQKPEWGIFKLGHTHPNQSNSGLMTLVLMACDYHKKSRGLNLKDILDPQFQAWMNDIENAASGMSNSTGNMMRDMVLRGPSTFDALVVYESVVIDYIKSAEGRWGTLHVEYPRFNAWNDNPYYVIDAPWSSDAQRKAADTFLDFLLSEPIQRESLKHGFRPGNPSVPIKFPDSPFVTGEKFGIKIDLPTMGETPRAEVINNLLAIWQRNQRGR